MARIGTVAIIGRPNTGKSTLFNRMAGKRRAIESSIAGTTRDFVSHRIRSGDMEFLLMDTGGIGGGSDDHALEDDVSRQSGIALETADVIVCTVNSQEELTSADYNVVERLRSRKRRHVPVLLAATKCDNVLKIDEATAHLHSLGIAEDIIPVSAAHNMGIVELEAAIVQQLKKLHFSDVEQQEQEDASAAARIALVGKPNAGKSSMINALMSDPQREQSPRLVSDLPGTTRDSADTVVYANGKPYLFVDTAGMRKKARIEEDLEYLSNVKSIQAIEDSDITVLVLDATQPVGRQDKRIAGLATDEGKGLLIAVNKSDLLSKEERAQREAEIRRQLPFCRFAEVLFLSAVTRTGLLKLFPAIDAIKRNRERRIPVKELLRWYEGAVGTIPAASLQKSKFITQADGVPPTFVIFVKNPKQVQVSQLRYLDNNIRSTFAFEGTPIRWVTKQG